MLVILVKKALNLSQKMIMKMLRMQRKRKKQKKYIDDVPSPNDPPTGETTAITGRVRKAPIWSADYITGEGLSDTEAEANMARVEIETLAFMPISDPTSFQEVVGHQKWKQAMDAEI